MSIGNKVIRIKETVSTNNYAKELALSGVESGTVVIAEQQTGGRGRLGRSFFSPGGKGIYMSVVLKPENPLLITCFAAVAVARAIKNICGVNVGIKWVNDIYLNGKKLCGILTEGVYEDNELKYAVLGIGVNVKKTEFPEDIAEIATSVENEINKTVSKTEVENEIIKELDNLYKSYTNGEFLEEYRRLSCVIGREIKVIRGNEEYFAVAEGIDEKGGLIVASNGQKNVLYSGEISIRFV